MKQLLFMLLLFLSLLIILYCLRPNTFVADFFNKSDGVEIFLILIKRCLQNKNTRFGCLKVTPSLLPCSKCFKRISLLTVSRT